MRDSKSLKSMVDAAIKKIDKQVIAERSFYDSASDRLFVTIFKGPRKTEFVILPRQLDANGSAPQRIEQIVEEAIQRLGRTPIG